MQVEKLTLAARFRRAALPTRHRVPDAGAAAQAARIEATPPDLTPRAYTGRGVRALAAAISLDGLPSSGLSVAALLESRGWTDIDAQRLFGIADVVALGYEAWQEAWRTATPERHAALQKDWAGVEQAALGGSLHLRGLYFLVLAFIQIAALVLTGFSLGSGSGFTLAQATAAGLGALLGLVWANGFGQLLARDPWSLYLEHARVLAGLAAFRIIALAMALAIGLAVAALGLCLVRAPSLVATVGLAAVYFLLFALYWLWVNTLLLLDLALMTVFSAVAGLAGMVLLQALWPGRWNPAFAPALGLALANLLMGLVAAAWWGWWRGSGRPTRPVPRLAGAAVSQLPYLAYGCGVGLLIILDRLIAWHTGAQTGFFEVQPSYDVSSSWALLAFLLAMVGQEWLLAGFLVHLRDRMHRHSVADLTGYRRALRQAYWLRLALGILIAAASGTAIAWLVGILSAIPWLQSIVPSGEGFFVLRWGLIGYCLLAVALLNTGLVIGFSRPNRLMLPLALALTADLAVGWTAAQATTYAASVLGLVAGSAVLLVSTFPQVLALLSTPVYSLCLDG